MSCAASEKNMLSHRRLALVAAMLLLCVCAIGQEGTKPKQTKSGKKSQTTSSGQKTAGESAQEKKPESAKSSSESSEGDQEEVKGPWHGLTWRLVGPFRGGRVLAVSGVVGDTHTYYFGGVGGGVWKTTDGG